MELRGLRQINGEDVYMRSSREVHKLIPGKVGSTVILGFKSADNLADYYEVECVRESTKLGEMTLDQISQDKQLKSGTVGPDLGDDWDGDVKVWGSLFLHVAASSMPNDCCYNCCAACWSTGKPWVLIEGRGRWRLLHCCKRDTWLECGAMWI